MDHYSHADRTALARAIGRLLGHCDCRGGGTPGAQAARCPEGDTARLRLDGGMTYCAFEPGSGIKVGPTGKVEFHRASEAARSDGQAMQLTVPASAFQAPCMSQIDVDPVSARPAGDAPKAPLPAAFRVCRLDGARPKKIRFRVAVDGPGGIAAGTEEAEAWMPRARRAKIQRRALVGQLPPRPNVPGRDLEPMVWAHEDGMCLDRLEGLARVGDTYGYRWNSTPDELAGFVSRLNASRPRALRLDRVIVNYGMYLTLFGNDSRTPSWSRGYPFYDGRLLYQNMSVLDGIALLHHPDVPHDGAYALSSAQGPVFVHGPSTMESSSDEIEISRHCGLVEPPRGAPGCPWGVRFGVEREHDADDEWPEDTG